MSKKKHYNNRGNNRGGGYAGKSNPTGAKLIAAIALLLAVAYVITSLALGMVWNPLKWGKKPDKPTAGKSPLTISISEENGISLTTSAESGEPKTVRKEASFTPADDEFSESNLDSAMSVIGKYLKANDDGCGEYFLFVFKFNGVYEYNGETIGSFENQNDFGLNNLNEFTVYPEDINIGDGVVIV